MKVLNHAGALRLDQDPSFCLPYLTQCFSANGRSAEKYWLKREAGPRRKGPIVVDVITSRPCSAMFSLLNPYIPISLFIYP
ncbi:uncharacterized protein CLUP02_05724 [Colletotrichum lupini]|uniref:Uncharacterized protein n=1 Tax=Colletotrichum lupini TaxID=145971 RepID=A0A9Q8WEW4_9PEZI|nr:uncharacterized protein CLUP02_05724 [Colletotrichum lupini]UQC80242.1 hypothetical protein CLUP02_05724 [Colletotrichum lupini]